jgi:6-phospho-beta-glucosidase
LTTNQKEAVSDASYVITQLRVGMMTARRNDEYLGHRHGLIGQETTGVGGMAKALRTIPVVLNIARDIQEVAPGALLVNFTNPAGLVTEALFRYAPEVLSIGVCNVAITTKMRIIEELEKQIGETVLSQKCQLDTLGLNHLTWHRGFTLDGVDFWPQIFSKYLDALRVEKDPEWDIHTIEALGMIPNYYVSYFYYPQKKLAAQKNWPPSRADQVIEIEQKLLASYADENLVEPPPELMNRGGAYYSTLATEILNSHWNDTGQVHVVNTLNNGAVPEWPSDWVLELPSAVDSQGIYPLATRPLPHLCFGLIAQVKSYEVLTIEAAVHGDRNAAYQALLSHPLGPDADQVQNVLDDVLETNKDFLPQFF